jgi:hypothetical protein
MYALAKETAVISMWPIFSTAYGTVDTAAAITELTAQSGATYLKNKASAA